MIGSVPAKILVIHDQGEELSLLRRELQAAHYDVITAENETEGVDLATAVQPDLILIDSNDPQFQGTEFFEMLGSNGYTRGIPLLCFKSNERPPDRPQTSPVDSSVLMDRSLDLNRLSTQIRRILTLHEQNRIAEGIALKKRIDLVSRISNDFRNHVMVITGFAALLEQKIGFLEPSRQLSYLQEINQHADYIEDIADGLDCLLLPEPRMENVDLIRILSTVLDRFQTLVLRKGHQMTVKKPMPVSVMVRGNSHSLSSAIKHMMSLFLKTTKAGSTIEVAVLLGEQRVMIELTDSGFQSHPEERGLSWNRVEPSLGMIVAESVAHQHGGEFGIESKSAGLRLWMSLLL